MLHLTRTVPVVFVVVADPVGSGFVKSLALPDGNATGFTIMEPSMGGKWLELLKEIAPQVRRVAFLFNPATAPYVDVYLNPFKAAALGSLGLEGFPAPVHEEFVEGVDRGQNTLFPECLEDWIGEDNPVRVVDVFVEELDLAELGCGGVDPEATGRPSYHPSILRKLYIYGYLNRVQSSRRLLATRRSASAGSFG